MSTDPQVEEAQKLLDWYRSFGSPHGPQYLTADQINDGLALVDAVKKNLTEDELVTGMMHFFAIFPPSIMDYAQTKITPPLVRNPQAIPLAWLDGLACGAAIMLMLIANEESTP